MLLNFKKQFVAKIERGEKTHTIRAKRKVRPRVGETCHCYTGLRQKGARRLGRWKCVKVENITIAPGQSRCSSCGIHHAPGWNASEINVFIENEPLSRDEIETFARADGFESFADMMGFWEGRLPFAGDLIHWKFEATV